MHSIMAARMAQRDTFRFIYDCIHNGCQGAFRQVVGKMKEDVQVICDELEAAVETVNGPGGTRAGSGEGVVD